MKRMRITGLVRAARIVREQLAAGIPPEHADDFRQRVSHTVEQVDAICREHNVKLQDLPTPSYQAYRYLASLDLDALPLRQGETPQRPQTVYVTNVITAQNDVNALFYDWAADPKHQATKLSTKHFQARRFARLLAEHVDEIEALAREQGGEPAHLPTRSRRAYQWLKFLSEPTTLLAHLETLRALLGEFHTPHCRAKPRQTVAQVGFALAQHLYIARPSAAGLRVTIHEGFVGAPAYVLRDLACTVLLRDQGAHQETIRSYAAGEDFLDVVLAMELTTATAKDVTRGSHFDLEQVFERVNAAYFASELARPRLTWNRMITGNKYGHYDRHRDTVMISVTLDAPGVPDYAIDYVMYHELLHKQMGIDAIGGRNYAHTPKFRAAERRFPHYVEAQAFFTAAREAVMARR